VEPNADNKRRVEVPEYIREIVEEVAFQAREDKRVGPALRARKPAAADQHAGECAEQRGTARSGAAAIRRFVTRVSDVYGRDPLHDRQFELEYEGEMRGAENIARELIRAAVGKTFTKYFPNANFQAVVQWFEIGGELEGSRSRVKRGSAGPAQNHSRTVRAPHRSWRAFQG